MRISSASVRGLTARAGICGLAALLTGALGALLAHLDHQVLLAALVTGLLGSCTAAAALLLAGRGHPLSLHREISELRRGLDIEALRHAEAIREVRTDLLVLSDRKPGHSGS